MIETASDTEEPAFIVTDRKSGQDWKIYKSGKIEGFPEGVFIRNRITAIESFAFEEGIKRATLALTR